MSREQELLLEELAAFRARVEATPPAPLSLAKAWTMTDWMDSLFPVRSALRPCLPVSCRPPHSHSLFPVPILPSASFWLFLVDSRRSCLFSWSLRLARLVDSARFSFCGPVLLCLLAFFA